MFFSMHAMIYNLYYFRSWTDRRTNSFRNNEYNWSLCVYTVQSTVVHTVLVISVQLNLSLWTLYTWPWASLQYTLLCTSAVQDGLLPDNAEWLCTQGHVPGGKIQNSKSLEIQKIPKILIIVHISSSFKSSALKSMTMHHIMYL